jgi:hypothetical protein
LLRTFLLSPDLFDRMSFVSAPWPSGILLINGLGAAPLLAIPVVIALVVLVVVFGFTAADPIEDRAGDREERWYPRLKFLSC